MIDTLPLEFRDGHIFVKLGSDLWLIDTGAPVSFGEKPILEIAGEHFSIGSSYFGLTAETLSQLVGITCIGLLGTDVLGCFDHIFDTSGGSLTVSTTELTHSGQIVCLDEFMGIPIFTARVGDRDCRMFFDTGAQTSFFQCDSITEYPSAGRVTDFYPGVGQFQIDTYKVPVSIGDVTFTLCCGTLPSLLGMTLMMASTEGIIGNAILSNRIIAYFPRRRTMVI